MTEFVQKVNYQRALQGELARTIQSMDEVQSARMHLALPEQGLFKKAQARSKASVTVGLKPGASFSRAQVLGVQRLVAASVPDIAPGDVAVLDQRGVVLSRSGPAEEALDEGWIERKRSTESYLAKKASQVLDRMFGEGASLVAVDVQLAEERRTATIEEVLPGHATRGAAAREGDAAGTESSSSETEYQVGRKTEQVHTPAGGVRRIGEAGVLKATLSDADAARVKDLVATAVGAQAQRGDTVAVTTLQRAAERATPSLQDAPVPADVAAPAPAAARESRAASQGPAWPLGIAVAGVLGLALWRGRGGAATLDARERQAVLDNVQHWLATGAGREAQP